MCSQCHFRPIVTSCEGCKDKFCYPCFDEHHNKLAVDFEVVVNRRNELMQMIQTQTSNSTTNQSSCLEEIDRWESEMYDHVNRVASNARELARNRLKEASRNIQMELDRLSEELQQRQKFGSYMEKDLKEMKTKLTELDDKMQKLKDGIRINTNASRNIAWDSLISVQLVNNTSSVGPARPTSNNYAYRTNSVNDRDRSPPPPYRYSNSSPVATPPNYSTSYRSSASAATPSNYGSTYRSPIPNTSVSSRTYQSSTYTCVCCKQSNQYYQNRQNYCSTCKQPAPF